jgi:hypothetical protein
VVGDTVVHSDGISAELIDSTYEPQPQGVPVYNFEVDDLHCYFVIKITAFPATVGGCEICFRFLRFEATNQIGADPQMFDFHMPFWNARFAFGSEGASLLFEILGGRIGVWS